MDMSGCLRIPVLTLVIAVSSPGLAADAPTRVYVGPDARLMVNGRPYFFIGLNPGPPVDVETPEGRNGWQELAEGGVTVVRGGMPGDWTPEKVEWFDRYMDAAWASGIRVTPNLREMVDLREEGRREQLASFIHRYKDHPGLLIWKSADEPEWGKIPVEPLREAYEIIQEIDPHHPVWICHAPRGTFETLYPYNVTCNVLSTDIYPVSEPPGKHSLLPNKGLSMVGDYTRLTARLAAEDRKMVFMVLQGCWSGVLPTRGHRLMFPTFREARYMMYQAIICGADSVSFFGLPFGLTGRDAELGWNWTWWRAVLRPLLAEVKQGSELYPVLTAPNSDYPLEFTGAPQIEARWKEASVYLYIFAAAREGQPQTVRFSGLQDGEVEVLFENRTIQTKDGAFEDHFREHDVHIYRALRVMEKPAPPAAAGGNP